MPLPHPEIQESRVDVSIAAVRYLPIDILNNTWFLSAGIEKRRIYWGNGLSLDKEVDPWVLLLVHL